MLRAEFSLPSVVSEDAAPGRKAPIRVKFDIPYYTVSGIQVCMSAKKDCDPVLYSNEILLNFNLVRWSETCRGKFEKILKMELKMSLTKRMTVKLVNKALQTIKTI